MTPVEEFLLVPFGMVEIEDALVGRPFVFAKRHAQQAVNWFSALGRKLAIDYEHQSFKRFNTRPDGLRPAAGWIGRVEVRDDGLWACDVTWTERAKHLLSTAEYKYFSPVIFWGDKDYNDLESLGPVALTNDPAMLAGSALAAGKEQSDQHMAVLSVTKFITSRRDGERGRSAHLLAALEKGDVAMGQVLQILGLPEDASLKDVLAAVTDDNKASVAEALGLPADATRDEVLAAIEAAMGGGSSESGGGGGAKTSGSSSSSQSGGQTTAMSRLRSASRSAQIDQLAKSLDLGEIELTEDALVAAVKSRMDDASKGAGELQQQVAELQTVVSGLRENNQRAQFDAVIASREHAGKIPPADQDQYFKLFQDSRKMFDTVIAGLKPAVSNASVLSRGTRTMSGQPRDAVIATARKTFAEEIDQPNMVMLCSERAWVNTALRDARQARLTDEEIAKHGIAGE